MKKPQNQVNVKVALPYPTGKGSGKVIVFAKTDEFAASLKQKVDKIVMDKEIEPLSKDKAKIVKFIKFIFFSWYASKAIKIEKTDNPNKKPPCKLAQSRKNKGSKNLYLERNFLFKKRRVRKLKNNQEITCGLIPTNPNNTPPEKIKGKAKNLFLISSLSTITSDITANKLEISPRLIQPIFSYPIKSKAFVSHS